MENKINFDAMINGLNFTDLAELRDKCELALNARAFEHELAIRKAIILALQDGYKIRFSNIDITYDDDDNPCAILKNNTYIINAEQ